MYEPFDMPASYDSWRLATPPRWDAPDDDPDDCDSGDDRDDD